MGRDLFDNSSESESEEIKLKLNKEYAKSYNKFRQKELIKKLKDKELVSSDSQSSSESDYSEEEVVINPKFDQEFLKTLSSLKKKDPKIYDKNTQFFANVDFVVGSNSKNKHEKAFTLKDYERKVILEKGGRYEDDDSSQEGRPPSPSFAEEQKKLKDVFKQVLNNDESEEEEFGRIFKRREITKEEKEKEEEQYLEWLSGKKDEISEESKETLKPLKQYWNKKDLPRQEIFLRDYILNNGYIDKEGDEIPTYDQIVGNENLSEDEEELEKQEEFEQKFNFRFEEPDKDFIKRFPRTIEHSVRKKDEKRKIKREEVKDRKQREKQEKYKEIEMLKMLKKKEIEEKIQKLKEITGNEELAFQDDDFNEDFDPDAHDKRMKEIFNEDYYQVDEGDEKPECPDIEDLKIEDWDNFDPQKDEDDEHYNYEPHCEDEDFNMDCDYDPNSKQNLQNELIESTKDNRKTRKRRNRFMEMIKAEKPAFNPNDEKTYSEYIDEYYKMDCEDIIGDTPCRFKYVETVPNDFGLTIEEILLAKTKELNQWASLKKAVQMRSEYDEKRDLKMYKLKSKNETLKRKIFPSLYGPQSEDESENIEKEKAHTNAESSNITGDKKKKRKKKVKSKDNKESNEIEVKFHDLEDKKSHHSVESSKKTKTKKSLCNVIEEKQIEKNSVLKETHKKSKKDKSLLHVNEKVQKASKSSLNKIKAKRNKDVVSPSKEISDDRLKAYGINPRKYHKKQKHLKILNNKNKRKSSQK